MYERVAMLGVWEMNTTSAKIGGCSGSSDYARCNEPIGVFEPELRGRWHLAPADRGFSDGCQHKNSTTRAGGAFSASRSCPSSGTRKIL